MLTEPLTPRHDLAFQAEITLKARLDELARAADWLALQADVPDLSDDLRFAMRLCLEEALGNIVMHGGLQAEDVITVGLQRQGFELIMTLRDPAPPSNPLAVVSRPPAESLAEATVGGFGLVLMRRYASRLDYRRDADGNRLILAFALPRRAR